MGIIGPDIPRSIALDRGKKETVGTTSTGAKVKISEVKSEIDSLIKELPKNEKRAAVLFFQAEKKLENLMKSADPETKKELDALQRKLANALNSNILHPSKDKQKRETEFLSLMTSTAPEDATKLDKMLSDTQAPRRFGIILSKELVLGMYSANTAEKSQAKQKCETLLKGLVTGAEMRRKIYQSMPELESIVKEYLFHHSPASDEMSRLSQISSEIKEAPSADSALQLFKEAMQKHDAAKKLLGKGQTSSWADDQIRSMYEQIEAKTIEVIDTHVKEKASITEKVSELKTLSKTLTSEYSAEKIGTLLAKFDLLTKEISEAYPKHPLLTTKLMQRTGQDPSLSQSRISGINKLSKHPEIQTSIDTAKKVLEEGVQELKKLNKEALLTALQGRQLQDKVINTIKVPQVVKGSSMTAVFQNPKIEQIFNCSRQEDFEAIKKNFPREELLALLRDQAYSYFVQLSGPNFVMGDAGEQLNKLLNALSDSEWMKQRGIDPEKFSSLQTEVKMLKEVFDELSIRPKKKPLGELTSDFLKTAGEMLFYLDPQKAIAMKAPLLQLPFTSDAKKQISDEMDQVIAKMQGVHQSGINLVATHAKESLLAQLKTEPNPQKRQELYSKAFQEDANLEEVATFCASDETKAFLHSIKKLAELLVTHSQTSAFSQSVARGSLLLRAQELLNIVSKGFGMTAYEMLRNCHLHEPRAKLLEMKAEAKEVNKPFDALMKA